METNIPIEQAIVGNSNSKRSNQSKGQNGKYTMNIPKKISVEREETHGKLAQLDNGPMMSTSEILDFSSGVDSTEYDQPKDR